MDRGEANEASQVAAWLSRSLASRRFRLNKEKVRSTIQRRRLPYEGSLILGQIHQARGDLYGISEDLAVIQAQLALLPTPRSPEEMARLTLPTS
jgi:hypothetical protein